MKVIRRILVLFLSVSLALTVDIPLAASAAKNAKLNKKSTSLKVGKTVTLKVKNTKKKVKWSIKSGKKYISLKSKKKKSVVVKAKKAGTAKVQAKVGKRKLTCKIKVAKQASGSSGSSGKTTNTTQTVTGVAGKNVPLPEGATTYAIGSKKLAIGMSRTDVNTVLGTLSTQAIRTGKSPQGFDTIAFNTGDYQEYLLIYLQSNQVVGICGIGKSMSFGDASAGENGNTLSADWKNINDYKTTSNLVAAKKKKAAANEMVYAFYDALGDNNIYCIQVFDPTKIKDTDNDMIYMTSNLSYNATVTSSIAIETGHMLNAFRAYRSLKVYYMNASLAKCAQDYCNTITASKIVSRNANSLLEAMIGCGVAPLNWGEGCYYGAADAISFANSLIQQEDFYPNFVNTKFSYVGVGMAVNGSHSYLAVDYVDAIQ